MTITRLLARPMLATIFVAGGINALRNTEGHAAKAKKLTDKVVPVAQQAVPKAPIPTDPATYRTGRHRQTLRRKLKAAADGDRGGSERAASGASPAF